MPAELLAPAAAASPTPPIVGSPVNRLPCQPLPICVFRRGCTQAGGRETKERGGWQRQSCMPLARRRAGPTLLLDSRSRPSDPSVNQFSSGYISWLDTNHRVLQPISRCCKRAHTVLAHARMRGKNKSPKGPTQPGWNGRGRNGDRQLRHISRTLPHLPPFRHPKRTIPHAPPRWHLREEETL